MLGTSPAGIVFCNCTYADVVPDEVKRRVLRELTTSGVAFQAVADLCEMSAHKDPRLTTMARSERMRIAACSPRAVKWLFYAGGAPLKDGQATVLNMRRQTAEHVIAGLLADENLSEGGAGDAVELLDTIREERGLPRDGRWVPWFPVIDYDLCANCKQCLGFCLFGVYGVDANDRVEVQRPERCKTGCPACARVCPSSAIIFPKYATAPVNGEVVCDDGGGAHEPVQVDVSKLLGGDIHAALRSRPRGGADRSRTDGAAPAAMPSGIELLHRLRTELDIPDNVIAELSGDCPGDRGDGLPGRSETPGGECPCKRNKPSGSAVPTTERSSQDEERLGKKDG